MEHEGSSKNVEPMVMMAREHYAPYRWVQAVGALIVVFAVIALAVARPVRWLNVPLRAWLIVAPWLLPGASAASVWSSVLSGAAVVLLSLPLGKIRDHYGSFARLVVWRPRAPVR